MEYAGISFKDPRTGLRVKMDREDVQILDDALRRLDAYDLCPDWPVERRRKLDKALNLLGMAMCLITMAPDEGES